MIAPKKQTGKPSITQNASLKRKNMVSIIATKMAPWNKLLSIISRRALR